MPIMRSPAAPLSHEQPFEANTRARPAPRMLAALGRALVLREQQLPSSGVRADIDLQAVATGVTLVPDVGREGP